MKLPGSMSALLRQPLLHFLLIGAGIGLLHAWLGGRDADPGDRTILVTSAEIGRLAAAWQARWNRPPTPEELDGLVQSRIREAALYREAVAMGLDRDDPVIRRVLVQRLEGMARDLVELSLAPTDVDLEAYFAANAEQYRPAPRITFTHVFVDPDRRGDRTLDDAAAMLAELRSLEDPTRDAGRFGDRFMLQSYYPEKDETRIGSLFGREFARSVFELPAGGWHGPVLSGYGTHLVHVEELLEFPVPDLEDVRDRVTQDWVDEKREEITDQYFADILARYDVVVEGGSEAGGVEATDAGSASRETPSDGSTGNLPEDPR